MRQIILDTETTGLEAAKGPRVHRVIEIGGVELIDRQLTGNNFHYYINPEREIEAGAMAVHGITNEFLQDKPLFIDIYKKFIDYITSAELIIHNAVFDLAFLDHELSRIDKKLGKITDYCSIIDTLSLARKRHPGQKNNLDALCKRYNVTNSNRNLHGALLDAQILADVYLAMSGGQINLFDLSNTAAAVATSPQVRTHLTEPYSLSVIKATEQELAAHQAYVTLLEQKSGTNLWEE